MSNEEILTRAIEKAIASGWKVFNLEQEPIEIVEKPLGTWDGYPAKSCLSIISNHQSRCVYEVIFDHDFAKALWGEKYFNAYEDDQAVLKEFECIDSYACDLHSGERWKIHLQQMITYHDPIAYLGEHLQ